MAGTTAASLYLDQTADQILKKANRQNNSNCGPRVIQHIYYRGGSCTVRDRLTACLIQPEGLDCSGFFCSFGKRDLLTAFKEEPHKRQEQHKF
jgi:hypothetical protein